MIRHSSARLRLRRWMLGCLCGLVWAALESGTVRAQPPIPLPEALPESLKLDDAVSWALQNNPELATFRQQRGIATAAVVIARTYPFNPAWTTMVRATNGPDSAGITNRVAVGQLMALELEVRGQGTYRRQAACAALTRTEWEIAFQELALALRVIRAFDGVLYYDAKVRLGEENIRLAEQTLGQVRKLVKGEVLGPADEIVARTEVDSAQALLNSPRAFQARARIDLRRALGVVEEPFTLQGALDAPLPPVGDLLTLVPAALDRRPDLRARLAAVREAEANVRLAVANRFGNPALGPSYEYNETRVNFIGAEMVVPLPVLNTHRGDILQREAERNRAAFDLRNTEVVIRQDVLGALERLQRARAWAETYRTNVLPNLQAARERMEALLGQAGVPVLSVIDIRRKLIQARDGYLDALYEVSQALADLAAAVGDPGLAIVP